jgi:hypothetical protein
MKIKFCVCRIGHLYKWSVFRIDKAAPKSSRVIYLDYGSATSDVEARRQAVNAMLEHI